MLNALCNYIQRLVWNSNWRHWAVSGSLIRVRTTLVLGIAQYLPVLVLGDIFIPNTDTAWTS